VDQPRLPYESLAANGRARFMLRMRLSLHCGCAAFATQGGSDHLFTVAIARHAEEAVDPTDLRGGTGSDGGGSKRIHVVDRGGGR
jgi:hypothetical protein